MALSKPNSSSCCVRMAWKLMPFVTALLLTFIAVSPMCLHLNGTQPVCSCWSTGCPWRPWDFYLQFSPTSVVLNITKVPMIWLCVLYLGPLYVLWNTPVKWLCWNSCDTGVVVSSLSLCQLSWNLTSLVITFDSKKCLGKTYTLQLWWHVNCVVLRQRCKLTEMHAL